MAKVVTLGAGEGPLNARALLEEVIGKHETVDAVVISVREDDVWQVYWGGELTCASLSMGAMIIRRQVEKYIMGEGEYDE